MKTNTQVNLCRAYLYSSAPGGRRRSRAGELQGPVVTISREAGSRGNSIAVALLEELEASEVLPKYRPWTVFNQGLLDYVIHEHNLPEKTADYFPEDKPEEVRSLIGEMLGLHAGIYTTVRKVSETVRRLAVAGNAIIVGRGANLIGASVPGALHVRLIGDPAARVRHFAKLHQSTIHQATEEVAKRDRARKRYIKANFGRDIDDPTQYDMVVNTCRFGNAAVARLVRGALEEKFR